MEPATACAARARERPRTCSETMSVIRRTPCVPAAHRGGRRAGGAGCSEEKCGETLEPPMRSTRPCMRMQPSGRPNLSRWNESVVRRRRRERLPCRATARSRSRVVPRQVRRALAPSTPSAHNSTTDPGISHRTGSPPRGPGHDPFPSRRKAQSRRPSPPRRGRTPAAPRAEARGGLDESVDLETRQTRGRLSRTGGAGRSRLNSTTNLQVRNIGCQELANLA